MTFEQLESFLAAVRYDTFFDAAESLHITQSTLSKHIRKLEQELGLSLFDRSKRSASLTAAGHSVYRDAKQMIDFAQEAVRKARHIAGSGQNQIRIGTSILRPCKRLVDLWNDIDGKNLAFQICIVPFDDDPAGIASVFSSSGKQIDCLIAPCDSVEWQAKYHILILEKLPCRIAVPRKHRLSGKKTLCWHDLDGEHLIIGRRGDSPVLDFMWDDILTNHPNIHIVDIPNRYDTSVFNQCEQMNYLLATLDIWADIHPSFVTLPMDWEYEIPYGIVWKKNASKSVTDFIKLIRHAKKTG